MWTDRKQNDQILLPNNFSNNKNTQQLTPRSRQRPNIPMPNQRKSITPSRIQQRVTSSPLRVPLERAIQKCSVKEKSIEKQDRSRLNISGVLKGSSRRDGDSSFVRRVMYQDEPAQNNKRAHQQTVKFIKRYFDFDNLIPLQFFIDRIVEDYEDLWSHQNISADHIIEHFTAKAEEMFGYDGVHPRDLLSVTRQNGMIGLILEIFKSINEQWHQNPPQSRVTNASPYNRSRVVFSKSPNVMSINRSFEEQLQQCANTQHLKNIIQQFMELMYKEMENQIYSKFNVEMKRMVLKYRDAERIMKKIQQKLTMNADYFQAEKDWQRKFKIQEDNYNELKKRFQRTEDEQRRQREQMNQMKNIKNRLEEENNKLRDNLQKYQNVLINKFESIPSSETSLPSLNSIPSLSRRITSTPLNDRTMDYSNVQNTCIPRDPQPFQIKIDTHFIQRDLGPPISQTNTTFVDQNIPPQQNIYQMNGGYSPLKICGDMRDSSRPSFDAFKAANKIGQFTYSPYQSRGNRPL